MSATEQWEINAQDDARMLKKQERYQEDKRRRAERDRADRQRLAGAEWVDAIDIPDTDPPMALSPVLLDEGPTVLFGMGETRKSIIAQIIATSIATGAEIVPGWRPIVTGPVLWLDYESGRRRFARRQRLLGPAPILYVPCGRPIWADADALTGLARDVGAALVVVDSIVPASAGGAISTKDAETAGVYFGAVNRIAPRSLSIGHVTKDGEATMPFGSVFFHNLARLTWRTRADDEGRVTLTNHKHTDGDRMPATTLVFDFGERLTVSHTSVQLTTAVLARIVASTGPLTFSALLTAVRDEGYGAGRSWLHERVVRAVSEGALVKLAHGQYGPGTGLSTGLSILPGGAG
jgi:AAA domain-containing protein